MAPPMAPAHSPVSHDAPVTTGRCPFAASAGAHHPTAMLDTYDPTQPVHIESHLHTEVTPTPEAAPAHDGSTAHHRRQRGFSSAVVAQLYRSENVALGALVLQLVLYFLLCRYAWMPNSLAEWFFFSLMVFGSYRGQRFLASGYSRIAVPSRHAARELPGKTAIITGGTCGIGLELALQLMHYDMHVIIAGRNAARGHAAVDFLHQEAPHSLGSVTYRHIDLASQDSVRAFVRDLPVDQSVDVLINNAGAFSRWPRFAAGVVDSDGIERSLASNFLSHFLLTELLLPRIHKRGFHGEGGKVINLASAAHINAPLVDGPAGRRHHRVVDTLATHASGRGNYALSKLCMVMHAEYLARRHHVRAFAVHPGSVLTNGFDGSLPAAAARLLFNHLICKTPREGAQTPLQCVLGPVPEPDLESSVPNGSNFLVRGGYYADGRLADECRHPVTVDPVEIDHFAAWAQQACL